MMASMQGWGYASSREFTAPAAGKETVTVPAGRCEADKIIVFMRGVQTRRQTI